MKSEVIERLTTEFGVPSREVVKVKSWNLSNNVGVVAQLDQPTREDAAYVWLPYPGEGQPVPEIALGHRLIKRIQIRAAARLTRAR